MKSEHSPDRIASAALSSDLVERLEDRVGENVGVLVGHRLGRRPDRFVGDGPNLNLQGRSSLSEIDGSDDLWKHAAEYVRIELADGERCRLRIGGRVSIRGRLCDLS